VCEVCENEYVFEDAVFTAVREKLQDVPLPEGLKQRVFDRLEEMRRADA